MPDDNPEIREPKNGDEIPQTLDEPEAIEGEADGTETQDPKPSLIEEQYFTKAAELLDTTGESLSDKGLEEFIEKIEVIERRYSNGEFTIKDHRDALLAFYGQFIEPVEGKQDEEKTEFTLALEKIMQESRQFIKLCDELLENARNTKPQDQADQLFITDVRHFLSQILSRDSMIRSGVIGKIQQSMNAFVSYARAKDRRALGDSGSILITRVLPDIKRYFVAVTDGFNKMKRDIARKDQIIESYNKDRISDDGFRHGYKEEDD